MTKMMMKILLADTDANERSRVKAMLDERGYTVVEAADAISAWEALQHEDAPHLALLDSSKAGIGGIQVCQQLRASGESPFIYTILLGSAAQQQEIAEGMELGADEFLTKPIDPFALEVRVRGGRRALQCRERLRNSEQIISYQSNRDSLTGTWNRVAIVDVLRRELSRAGRERTSVAVLLVALDGLSKLNRSHNYNVGDQAIRAFALRLTSIVRPYDSVGRYGGEVFLVVAPGCDEAKGVKQAMRIQTSLTGAGEEALKGGIQPLPQDNAIWLPLSMGVAAVNGGSPAETILHAAEEALSKARKEGGNCIESVLVVPTESIAHAA
jgi:diguanylate cyclase (GGDEF)-like protein